MFLWAFVINKHDIMAPSSVMCAMFLISTCFAMLNAKEWDIHYGAESCFILLSGIFVYLLAETLFRIIFEKREVVAFGRKRLGNVKAEVAGFDASALLIAAILVFDAIVIAMYVRELMRVTGHSVLSPEVFSTYRRMTVHLGSVKEGERIGALYNQLLKIVRASGFAAEMIIVNNIIAKKKHSHMFGLVLIVIFSMMTGIILASRLPILQLGIAAAVEYYVLWHQKNGWHRNLSWRYILIGLGCLLVGIPLFSVLARVIGEGTELSAFRYASIYLGSSIQLFDLYVKDPTEALAFGEESLAGARQFLDRLNFPVSTRDVNLEFRSLADGVASNVYSFFRRPMHDFGLAGMYVFTALVAMLFAWLYYGKIKNRKINNSRDIWTLAYGYIFYWMVLSSIEQYSCLVISFNFASYLAIILAEYACMTRVRLCPGKKWKKRSIRLCIGKSVFDRRARQCLGKSVN